MMLTFADIFQLKSIIIISFVIKLNGPQHSDTDLVNFIKHLHKYHCIVAILYSV